LVEDGDMLPEPKMMVKEGGGDDEGSSVPLICNRRCQ
jgi:hypothetical protein